LERVSNERRVMDTARRGERRRKPVIIPQDHFSDEEEEDEEEAAVAPESYECDAPQERTWKGRFGS
jgi:hypothetical protein